MSRLLLLRNQAFGRFWAARILSILGTYVTITALTLYVYKVSGPLAVTLLMLSLGLPRLLGPFAGAVADRMDGRRLMIYCDLGEAALMAAIALFLPPLPVLFVLVACASVFSTLFFPAGRSAVPVLVGDEDLSPANALLGSAFNLSLTLGPLLGALAFTVAGIRGALAFDALTFLASAALIFTLPALPTVREVGERAAGVFVETREGLVYVARHPVARAVVVGLLAGVTFLGVDLVALVFLAGDSLKAGPAGYGLLLAAHGVGMILGPLILMRGTSRAAPVGIVFLGLFLEGAVSVLTGLVPFFAIAVLVRVLGGVGNGIENAAADITLQRVVERRMLGRVFGVFYGGVMLAETLGSAIAGPLVALTSPREAFVVSGVATLVVVALVWWLMSRLSPKQSAPG